MKGPKTCLTAWKETQSQHTKRKCRNTGRRPSPNGRGATTVGPGGGKGDMQQKGQKARGQTPGNPMAQARCLGVDKTVGNRKGIKGN